MLTFNCTVHSVAPEKLPVTAQLNGEDVTIEIDGTVFELVSDDETFSQTYRMPGEAGLVAGDRVTVTLDKASGEAVTQPTGLLAVLQRMFGA